MSIRQSAAYLFIFMLAFAPISAFAGGVPKELPPTGIIESVDAQARTIVILPNGAEEKPTFLAGWIVMLTAMMLPSEISYVRVFASVSALLFPASIQAE